MFYDPRDGFIIGLKGQLVAYRPRCSTRQLSFFVFKW